MSEQLSQPQSQQIKPSHFLVAGRQHLIDFGWVQNRFGGYEPRDCGIDTWAAIPGSTPRRKRGPACAVGALNTACAEEFNGVYFSAAFRRARYYLSRALTAPEGRGTGFGEVTSWNDAAGRTKEEVIDLYNRAIELAEQEEDKT